MVVHCKKSPYDVYIGRPKYGQHWGFGNPFEIGVYGDRETVVNMYERWLVDGTNYNEKEATEERRKWILENLKELKGKTLGCFCSPLACHGDVLTKLANE